jgi:hypothetical protein
MKFDFIINVHSMDEMDFETIDKMIKVIGKSKKSYLYLKNHFITYNLGDNKSEAKDWCDLIPFNKWRPLENNYCAEEGIKSHPTFERIFKIEE